MTANKYFTFLLPGILFFACNTSTIVRLPETIDKDLFKVLKGKTDTIQHAYLLGRVQAQYDSSHDTRVDIEFGGVGLQCFKA